MKHSRLVGPVELTSQLNIDALRLMRRSLQWISKRRFPRGRRNGRNRATLIYKKLLWERLGTTVGLRRISDGWENWLSRMGANL
jgi:hypothetical protein